MKTWPLVQLTVIVKILVVNTLHFAQGYFRNIVASLVGNVVCISVFDIISGKFKNNLQEWNSTA